jgi:hypothetical protein
MTKEIQREYFLSNGSRDREVTRRTTEDILNMLQRALNKELIIPGIEGGNLLKTLDSEETPSLLISDKKGRKIALLRYDADSSYNFGDVGPKKHYSINLTIFGEEISPEKFNDLQTSDKLKLAPWRCRHPRI